MRSHAGRMVFRAGMLLALVALSSRTLADCFSRITSTRIPESSMENDAEQAMAPAAAAWLQAARRTAEGHKDSATYWQVAWDVTEAWWLRPVAFTVSALVAFGAILQQPDRFRRGQVARPEVPESPRRKDSTDTKARRALEGLQRMELPFFGTSSSWSDAFSGVVVSGNPRTGAVENWEESEVLLRQSVEKELGYPVHLHLLRRDKGQEDGIYRPYELLVRDATTKGPNHGMMSFGLSLSAVWWCSTQLDSNPSLQQLGSVIQPGSSAPWLLALGLVLMGELARTLVAIFHGVSIGPRTLLPSPQLGIAGVFAPADTASPSRSAALATSLAAPFAVAASSVALGLFSDFVPELVSLKTINIGGFGPMAFLPAECRAVDYAAAQGLLMSALALLPQSPDGRSAWSVLVGREKAQQLARAASYVYPLVGVLCMWCFGSGFLSQPFTWALLLTNLNPKQPPPPLEEATQVSDSERAFAFSLLVAAALAAAPVPWAKLFGA